MLESGDSNTNNNTNNANKEFPDSRGKHRLRLTVNCLNC